MFFKKLAISLLIKLATVTIFSLTAMAITGQAGTLDDYYLQQFGETSASALKSLSASTTDQSPTHCGMPLKHDLRRDWDQLEASTQKVLAKQLAAPVLANEATLASAGGHFLIHYATTGTDAPTPAFPDTVATWVAKVAASFESSFASYQGLGYRPPPGTTYHVYLRSLAALRLYGQTTTSGAAPSAGFPNAVSSFIEVDKDSPRQAIEVEAGITSGDYLHGFLRGTRSALYESGRESITLNISQVDAFHIGVLVALYERAVGFYGSLVNINAYNQPGVEAGKKAATKLLLLQQEVREKLAVGSGKSAEEIARLIDADPEEVFHVLRHLASNDSHVRITPGETKVDDRFSLEK